MALTLTSAAAEVIRSQMEKDGLDPHRAFLRVGVKGGGCSGMTYDLTFEAAPGESDSVFESQGLRVMVDRKSYLFINGTQIDYGGPNPLTRGFKFENPNVAQACGCGTSFYVK